MTGQTTRLTNDNDITSEKMQDLDPGVEQCELPEKKPQICSECLDNKQNVLGTVLTSSVIVEKSNDVSVEELNAGAEQRELSEKTPQVGSECLDNKQNVLGTALTSSVIDEKSNDVSDKLNKSSVIQLPASPQHDLEKCCQTAEGSCLQQSTLEQTPVHLFNDKSENKCQPFSKKFPIAPVVLSLPAQANNSSSNGLQDPVFGDVKSISPNCLAGKSKSSTPTWLNSKGKRNSKLLNKKYILRSIGSSDRALRSRTQEKPKPPESNSNLVDVNNGVEKKLRGKKKKKKKRRDEGVTDEFSRIRSHLRYLLNRVSYEQSLIDAYSGEGWKGYSMEKLKPEKELQRAKSEILRRKLKIRDLFQNLDSLCAEGRLPQAVFDSEGEIDSEDIFCAKCSSKELSTDNDIILCDGACDRGFHQLCLNPPLLTENIPSGDESWLCPGCDCKEDCIEFVNDSLGTKLSLDDTWERVFPEAAAAAAAGNNVDNNLGLPSDDSDDDDYNPDVPEDVEVEGGESSSNESEYASASEKLEDSHHEDQYLGLPSEDSEDDDYDPDAPDRDNRVAEGSSSSDFTSDSEDLAATIKDNISIGQDDDVESAPLDNVKTVKGSSTQICKVGKKPSIADELSSLLESDPGQGSDNPVSGKRNIERLDYKKLYDETYQSDTSDDEDWTVTATPNRKKNLTGKVNPVSPNGKALNNSAHTPRNQNKVENTNNSPTKSLECSGKSGSRNRKSGSSTNRRLGEAAVQRLYESFKENQYPDRATKEGLAQEVGLTYQQVTKWFDNTRWAFRHPSSNKGTGTDRNASEQAIDSRPENEGALSGEQRDCGLVPQEGSGEKSRTPNSRKRKHVSEPQASEANHQGVDTTATVSPASSPKAKEMQTGHKMKTRRRK